MMSFGNRVAMVTGAGAGLGRAYALALARRGARVVVNDLSADAAATVAREIADQGGAAIAAPGSVTDPETIAGILAEAQARWGGVHILINNAGLLRDRSFAKMTLDEWAAVMNVHLDGAFTATRAVWDVMRAQGYGRILMTTSSNGLFGAFGQANYSAAKAGIVGFMKTLSIEGAKYGIRANAIAPIAATAMTESDMRPELVDAFRPERVAPVALYLVSDDAPTNAILCTGGGVFYVGGNNIGLFDIDRVEVLRGPQGTLFGRNTIGGAVQYVTKKPTDRFEGYVDGIGGSYSRHDFQGAINLPLTSTLALRFAFNTQDRDGFVHDLLNGTDHGEIFQRQLRAQLRWKPLDRLTIDLEGNFTRNKTNARPIVNNGVINPNAQFVGLARLFGETRPLTTAYESPGKYTIVGFGSPDYASSNYYEGQGVISYELTDNLSLKSITAYQHLLSRNAMDFDLTPLNILSTPPSDGFSINNALTQEGQLVGHVLDDRLRFTLGVYYIDNRSYTVGIPGVLIGRMATQPNGDSETDINSTAFYGQATFNLTPRLSVTGGLRYSKEDNHAFSRNIATLPNVYTNFTNLSPYGGVNFQATDNLFFYGKYSQGFKAGGQNVSANLPGGSVPFGPERAETYEIGARLQLFDRRLHFNPTLFYTNWNDIQFNLLIPLAANVVIATQNAGSAVIKGFELETELAATKHLLLNAAASFNNSYYVRVPGLTRTVYYNGFPGPGTILSNIGIDSALNRAPTAKISFGGRYTVPLANDADVSFNLSGVHTSGQYANVTYSDQIFLPANTVFQGRVQYDFGGGKYSAAFFVTNLFDKYYYISGQGFGRGYTVGVDELDPGRPREFGAQLTARF